MSHTNRNKPVMTSNGKTIIMFGISIGAVIFMMVPGTEAGLAGFGFGIMLFSTGILVANQLPLWELKVRAADSSKTE